MADETHVKVKHIKPLVQWIKDLITQKLADHQQDLSKVTGVLAPEHGGTGCESIDDLKEELGIAAISDPAVVTFRCTGGADKGSGAASPSQFNAIGLTVASSKHFTFQTDQVTPSGYSFPLAFTRIRVDKTGLYEIDMSPSVASTKPAATESVVWLPEPAPIALNLLTAEDVQYYLDGGFTTETLKGTPICECRSAITGTDDIGGISSAPQEGYQVVYLEAGTSLKAYYNAVIGTQVYLKYRTSSATVTIRQIG